MKKKHTYWYQRDIAVIKDYLQELMDGLRWWCCCWYDNDSWFWGIFVDVYISGSMTAFAVTLFLLVLWSWALNLSDLVVDYWHDGKSDYVHELQYESHLIYLIYRITIISPNYHLNNLLFFYLFQNIRWFYYWPSQGWRIM